MKITVLGGGGVRSMFLAKSIAQKAKRLGIDELCFMDNDEEKLRIYGGMAAHVARLLCPEMRFSLTADPVEAAQDANYVITTIRVGQDEMRAKDERIALDHGVLGQETTGAAGLSFAMRSVPALAAYCELIKKYAKPSVKVFNFTNPAGVVSQTLRDMGYDFTYGICDAPSGMLRSFALLYGANPANITGEVYGLNHLSYFKSITINGKEILHDLIENDDAYKNSDMRYFSKELLRDRGAVLNEYLYYFYYREQAVANILKAPQTRGEQILDINRQMTAQLRQMDIENDFAGCLAVFNKFIENAQSGQTGPMILCVPNGNAIDGLRPDDVVEVTCEVGPKGCTPHRIGAVDEQNLELIRRVKNYERLASKAIREKSRAAAVQALTLHPLVNSYSLACALTDAYIAHNKDYCDGWH